MIFSRMLFPAIYALRIDLPMLARAASEREGSGTHGLPQAVGIEYEGAGALLPLRHSDTTNSNYLARSSATARFPLPLAGEGRCLRQISANVIKYRGNA